MLPCEAKHLGFVTIFHWGAVILKGVPFEAHRMPTFHVNCNLMVSVYFVDASYFKKLSPKNQKKRAFRTERRKKRKEREKRAFCVLLHPVFFLCQGVAWDGWSTMYAIQRICVVYDIVRQTTVYHWCQARRKSTLHWNWTLESFGSMLGSMYPKYYGMITYSRKIKRHNSLLQKMLRSAKGVG